MFNRPKKKTEFAKASQLAALKKTVIKKRFNRRGFIWTLMKLSFAGLWFVKSSHAMVKKKLLDEDFFSTTPSKLPKKITEVVLKKWQRAFEGGVREIFDGGTLTRLGKVPKGINGYIFRNGGSGFASQIRRANHTYEQEAMVQAIRVKNGSLGHYASVPNMPQYAQELKAGKPLFSRWATQFDQKESSVYYQPPNMNVLGVNEVLYLLGDNVYPKAVDKNSFSLSEGKLLSRQQTNSNADNKETILNFRFSSHPIQTERGIWNAVPVWKDMQEDSSNVKSIDQGEGIALSRFTPAGSLAVKAFHQVENVGYFHSFLLTDTHVIVVMPPYFRNEDIRKSEAERWEWQPSKSTRIFVFRIDTLQLLQTFNTKSFYCEHYSNAYFEKKTDEIVFDGFVHENPNSINSMHGQRAAGVWEKLSAKHTLFKMNLNSGELSQKVLHQKNFYEMPSIDPRQRGKKHTMVVALKRGAKDALSGGYGYFRKLVVLNPRNNQETGYRFTNPQEIIEEHVYVPDFSRKPGYGGWIVGTSYDLNLKKSVLSIFEKDSIAKGPTARSFFPYGLPIGMHGTFSGDYS